MLNDQIYPIPPVPPGILEAVNDKRLAVFVGAGVSGIMGCKGWDELAKDLVKKCTSITGKDSSFHLVFGSIEILSQYTDHTKTITICYEIMKETGREDAFFDVLKKSFQTDKKQDPYKDIYNQIYGLRGLFITTNADEHFDFLFSRERTNY